MFIFFFSEKKIPRLQPGQICIDNWASGTVKRPPDYSVRLVLIDKAIDPLVSFLLWELAKGKKILLSFGLGAVLAFGLKAWKCWRLSLSL